METEPNQKNQSKLSKIHDHHPKDKQNQKESQHNTDQFGVDVLVSSASHDLLIEAREIFC